MARKKKSSGSDDPVARDDSPVKEEERQQPQSQEETTDSQPDAADAPDAPTQETTAQETAAQEDPALALARKCDEYLAMAQRVQADFENFKRRNETARAQAYQDGLTDALTAMLPVMDNFERALASAGENTDASALLKGIAMVKKQLDDVFAARKCEVIPSEKGMAFDPSLHNAVMTAPREEGFAGGTVAATFQKGYRIGDKIIRYAMVSVFEHE